MFLNFKRRHNMEVCHRECQLLDHRKEECHRECQLLGHQWVELQWVCHLKEEEDMVCHRKEGSQTLEEHQHTANLQVECLLVECHQAIQDNNPAATQEDHNLAVSQDSPVDSLVSSQASQVSNLADSLEHSQAVSLVNNQEDSHNLAATLAQLAVVSQDNNLAASQAHPAASLAHLVRVATNQTKDVEATNQIKDAVVINQDLKANSQDTWVKVEDRYKVIIQAWSTEVIQACNEVDILECSKEAVIQVHQDLAINHNKEVATIQTKEEVDIDD